MLIGCPNHFNWLLSMRRSSGSAPRDGDSFQPLVSTTFSFESKFMTIEEERQLEQAPSTGAVIGGIIGALIFICIIIGIIFFIRKRQEDGEGPPKHKPPPPVKAGSSTEMLNKPSEPPTATETAPLSPGEVYYEPTGGEPVTNLDDETTGALNGGAAPVLDNVNELKDRAPDGHHGNDLESSNHDPPAANISRGESFVSPAMYV